MSVGIIVPLPAYTLNPAFIAKKAEDLGFESIWYHEHPILPVHSESPFPATGGEIPWTYRHFSDPYMALAMAAAVTENIKLCTGVHLLPYHHPAELACRVAYLDHMAQGRFMFGIGSSGLPIGLHIVGRHREEETVLAASAAYEETHPWAHLRPPEL